MGQVGVQAGKRKEDGHEQGDDEAPQLFVDVAGQDRRLADENPGHERTQHGMYANQMRGERHRAHDDENCGDHRHFADKIVVGPADDAEHETPPERKAGRKKDCRSEHALTQGERVHLSVNRQAGGDRDDDPSDRVVDDGRGDQRHPDVSAHETHLAHDHCHDLHRGNRQRRAEKQRGNDPLVGSRQHCRGQQLAEREPASEGDHDPRGRRADGGTTRLLNQLEVGLHPGQQQQHQDAKLRDGIDHALLLRTCGEDRALRLGPDRAEYRRTKQNSGDQLPHDGRLPDPLHRLAHQASDQEQQNDLRQKERLRWGLHSRPPRRASSFQ